MEKPYRQRPCAKDCFEAVTPINWNLVLGAASWWRVLKCTKATTSIEYGNHMYFYTISIKLWYLPPLQFLGLAYPSTRRLHRAKRLHKYSTRLAQMAHRPSPWPLWSCTHCMSCRELDLFPRNGVAWWRKEREKAPEEELNGTVLPTLKKLPKENWDSKLIKLKDRSAQWKTRYLPWIRKFLQRSGRVNCKREGNNRNIGVG